MPVVSVLEKLFSYLSFHNFRGGIVLSHICFLRAQKTGTSQKVLLNIIDEILHEDYGCSIAMCGVAHTDTYIYIDDGIYTGSRLRYDLTDGAEAVSWIPKKAPSRCTLIVYHMAVHLGGDELCGAISFACCC